MNLTYLDENIFSDENFEEHLKWLETVFQHLAETGKQIFDQVAFLSQNVSSSLGTLYPIVEWRLPRNNKSSRKIERAIPFGRRQSLSNHRGLLSKIYFGFHKLSKGYKQLCFPTEYRT